MLDFSKELWQAYALKEALYALMASTSRTAATVRLVAFDRLQIREFRACAKMLRNWKKYILNAFDVSCSKGFTEGCKNTAKTLKRHAFGFHNFLHFHVCILWTVAAHPHICQRAQLPQFPHSYSIGRHCSPLHLTRSIFRARILWTVSTTPTFAKEAAKSPRYQITLPVGKPDMQTALSTCKDI